MIPLFILLSWALFFGFSANREPAGKSLKIMTFNIRYGTAPDGNYQWSNRQEHVYRLLQEQAPDIIGLQEALHFQNQAILEHVAGYECLGVGRDDGDTSGEYSAILYRAQRLQVRNQGTFWFSQTPDVPGSKHWGNSITRICTWAHFEDDSSGRSFYVYNLHLDHQSQPSREKSIDLLLDKIDQRDNRDPVIVTGDFNAGENNPAVISLLKYKKRFFRPSYFIDSFRLLHPQDTNVGTFHGFSDQAGEDKIDYIFVDRRLEVKAAEILRVQPPDMYISDHYPVTATIILN